jgi:hypothetical protein
MKDKNMAVLGIGTAQALGFWDYFSFSFFFSPPHTFLPEGVVLGLGNLARSCKSQKNKIWG